MHKCESTSCKRAHARFIAIARVYNSCARIYAQIWMKFDTYDHKIAIDHHIKFHEDLSFRCGDICKTILVFFNSWFSMYFSGWYHTTYKYVLDLNLEGEPIRYYVTGPLIPDFNFTNIKLDMLWSKTSYWYNEMYVNINIAFGIIRWNILKQNPTDITIIWCKKFAIIR